MVNTPVLFETFVRVEYARQVWDAIKEAQPKKLYFYSNKGRAGKKGEVERNNEIRSWVKEIDWDCEVHTWFREECVDVYTSLFGAISWLFKNEERGIVLEDDCVPTKAFFQYCDYFLDYYAEDKEIFCITGDNYTNYVPKKEEDHILSRKGSCYGWATWKDRFDSVDFNKLPSDMELSAFLRHFKGLKRHGFLQYMFYQNLQDFIKETHCWDYIWGMSCIQSNRYFVTPVKHLIKNVGVVGEHTDGSDSNNVVYVKDVDYDEDYVFCENRKILKPNDEYDKKFFDVRFPAKPIIKNYVKQKLSFLFK